MNLKAFQRVLTVSSVGFFVLALAFDLTVSYSVYSTHSEYFFNLEQNQEIVRMIKFKEIPYKLIFQSSLGFFPIAFYALESKFKKSIFSYLLIASVFVTIMMGYAHLQGGLGWWRM